MRVLRDYLLAVSSAVASRSGDELAALLSLDKAGSPLPIAGALPGSGKDLALACSEAVKADRIAEAVGEVFPSGAEATRGWHLVLVNHLTGAAGVAASDWDKAFTGNHEALKQFLPLLQAAPTKWVVPALHTLARDCMTAIRAIERAQLRMGVRDGAPSKRNALVTDLRSAFNYTALHRVSADQLPQSKKWGALAVANMLLATYFRLDRLRQGKFITQAVEGKGFPALDEFPRSQAVTYRYYAGVLAAYQDRYASAATMLTAALRGCHSGYAANVRRILRVLVPVSLYASGRVPSPRLLAKYDLDTLYGPIVAALKTGNVKLFNDSMEAHRDAYIRAGVFLILERLQMHVYRTLIKRICTYLMAMTGSPKLRLPHILAGMHAAGLDTDADELECLLANLIFRKSIRGYLSHKPAVLVLARDGAFKPLPAVLAESGPAGCGVEHADP